MKLDGLQLVIVVLIYFATIINANIIVLDGECPFDNLEASPEAYVRNFGGEINVLAETRETEVVWFFFEKGPDRSDETIYYMELDPEEDYPQNILATTRYRSTETGECTQFNTVLKAVDIGVYETYYADASFTENNVAFKTYFLYFEKGQLGVSFMCRNRSEEEDKYEVELKILSGSTKELSDEINSKVQEILNSNNISYLEEYLHPIENNNPC